MCVWCVMGSFSGHTQGQPHNVIFSGMGIMFPTFQCQPNNVAGSSLATPLLKTWLCVSNTLILSLSLKKKPNMSYLDKKKKLSFFFFYQMTGVFCIAVQHHCFTRTETIGMDCSLCTESDWHWPFLCLLKEISWRFLQAVGIVSDPLGYLVFGIFSSLLSDKRNHVIKSSLNCFR